jgi:hypothetical protein
MVTESLLTPLPADFSLKVRDIARQVLSQHRLWGNDQVVIDEDDLEQIGTEFALNDLKSTATDEVKYQLKDQSLYERIAVRMNAALRGEHVETLLQKKAIDRTRLEDSSLLDKAYIASVLARVEKYLDKCKQEASSEEKEGLAKNNIRKVELAKDRLDSIVRLRKLLKIVLETGDFGSIACEQYFKENREENSEENCDKVSRSRVKVQLQMLKTHMCDRVKQDATLDSITVTDLLALT